MGVFDNAKTDAMGVFQRTYTTITEEIPWSFKNVGRSAKMARDSIYVLFAHPMQAIKVCRSSQDAVPPERCNPLSTERHPPHPPFSLGRMWLAR